MSIFSTLTSANSFESYHKLSDNQVVSENYEVKKIITGRIDAVLFSKEANAILVIAERYMWKINSQGQVTDTFRGASDLHRSGVYLWRSSSDDSNNMTYKYNDWVYSGDKSAHDLSKVLELTNLSDAELIARFDNADIVEFYTHKNEDKSTLKAVLLKEKNHWYALDISHRFGDVDYKCREYKKSNNAIWRETCVEGYDKKNKFKLSKLTNILGFQPDFNDQKQPLHIKKFSRQSYHFEEGFFSWLGVNILGRTILSGLPGNLPTSFWYGTGYFQLKHHTEHLNFKAFVSNEDGRIDFPNISIYNVPEGSEWDLKLIEIDYIGGEYSNLPSKQRLLPHHESEVGLYAVRKKNNSPQTSFEPPKSNPIVLKQASSYYTQNPWMTSFTGDFITHEYDKPIWGDIQFFNAHIDSRHYLMNPASAQKEIYAIPSSLTFIWPGKHSHTAYKVYANDGQSFWFDFHLHSDDISFKLIFDEVEIVEAFTQLDGSHQPLQLEINLEEIKDVGGTLVVRLRNDKQSITLNKTTYDYAEPVYTDTDQKKARLFEKSKLKIEHTRALADKAYLQDFISVTQNIVNKNLDATLFASDITQYTVSLFQHLISNKNYVAAETLLYHFANSLYLKLRDKTNTEDAIYNTSVIASQGLVLSLITNNKNISELIFEKLMGADFDISKQNNPTFMFNLACYYAVNNEKELLLVAMKQALKLGKDAAQFMSDTDFKDYWNDSEFLAALAQSN